jgi:hypothetical protein
MKFEAYTEKGEVEFEADSISSNENAVLAFKEAELVFIAPNDTLLWVKRTE